MNTSQALHRVAEIEIERIEAITQRSAGPLRDMLVLHLEQAMKTVYEAGAASARPARMATHGGAQA